MIDVCPNCGDHLDWKARLRRFRVPSDGMGGLAGECDLIYLQTRLGSLDDQISEIFTKQEATEALRSLLREMQETQEPLDAEAGGTLDAGGVETLAKINGLLDQAGEIDPDLAKKLAADIADSSDIYTLSSDGKAQLTVNGGEYEAKDVAAAGKAIENALKDLESSAQLEMIQLQSLMSARQTAIQLATNMASAIGEGMRMIASNIGK